MLERHTDEPYASTPAQRESLSQLLGNLAIQTANLVRDELALVRRELEEKGKHFRSAALVVTLGAGLAFISSLVLCAAIVLVLSEYLEPWQSALLVGAGLGISAGALIAFGVSRLKQASLKPEQTIQSMEENKEWLKEIT
jgi:drug/metabolite transporter (DMT)-like permease